MGTAASAQIPERIDFERFVAICSSSSKKTQKKWNEEAISRVFNTYKEQIDGCFSLPKSFVMTFNRITDIFVTYDLGYSTHENRKGHDFVKRICQALEARGFTIWLDTDRMLGRVETQLTAAIDNCQLVLVLVTKSYIEKCNSVENCKDVNPTLTPSADTTTPELRPSVETGNSGFVGSSDCSWITHNSSQGTCKLELEYTLQNKVLIVEHQPQFSANFDLTQYLAGEKQNYSCYHRKGYQYLRRF